LSEHPSEFEMPMPFQPSLAAADFVEDDDPHSWPTFGLTEDIRPSLAAAQAAGHVSVLATLYCVEGGAPRGVGAQMLFVERKIAGFLSGGCIEADVALHAQTVLADGLPCRLHYGQGGPIDIHLPCGSHIEVFLERIPANDVAATRLCRMIATRQPVVWVSDGHRRLCIRDDRFLDLGPPFEKLSQARQTQVVCGYADEPFSLFRAYVPATRLIAIGADPVTLATARLAVEMGMETTVIRPNGPETPPVKGARYLRNEVSQALGELAPDPWTAIAVLSHDKAQEHDALKAALATSAGYIGAMGSRRRIAERNTQLLASGVKPVMIDQLHAPIGLPIGGFSPWKIAVSVLAEIVAEIG
jgi:xanthine dehydrogenase accessory factor